MDYAVLALDADDLVVGLNHPAKSLFDIHSSAIGTLVGEAFAEYPEFLDLVVTNTRSNHEIVLHLDGEGREYEVAIEPVLSDTELVPDAGDTINRLVVLRDLSDAKHSEQNLERFRTLVTESSDAFTHIRPDGTMAYVSGTEEVVGRTSEEFINESLETFLHPDDKEEAVAFFESLRAGRNGRVQARFKHGDGSWVWIETTGTTVSDSSMIDGAITISRDITQRKRRERQLERQNERLDRFASVVSHDLRNPLGVATGYAEIAEETGDTEAFEKLHTAHNRMGAMISELLVMAKAGTTIENSEPVSIAERAKAAWETTDTRGMELIGTDSLDVTVDAKPELLTHIFENLFRNTTDHNEPPLTVTVGKLEADSIPIGFYVQDDGQGIDPADREAVFEEEFSTGGESGGLGLSIVQEFVDAHGWELRLRESERGGARFEITNVELAAE